VKSPRSSGIDSRRRHFFTAETRRKREENLLESSRRFLGASAVKAISEGAEKRGGERGLRPGMQLSSEEEAAE